MTSQAHVFATSAGAVATWSARLAQAARAGWLRRRDPWFRAEVVLLGLLVGAVAAFAHVAEDYLTGDPLVRWDLELASWLHEHPSQPLTSLMSAVTLAGNAAVLAGVTLLGGLYLARRRRLNDVAVLFVAALGIELLNALVKLAFHRPRPELSFVHLDTFSFPSGHAASSAAIYAVLGAFVARDVAPRGRALIGVAVVLLPGIVAFSRLYLGAHYLSDVLAGLSLGIAWAAGCLFASVAFRRRDVRNVLPLRLTALVERIARAS